MSYRKRRDWGPSYLSETARGSELGVPVAGVLDGALLRTEIYIGQTKALRIGDAAEFVGGIEIGAAILSDFQGRGFVFAGDAENEVVEAVGPDFPGEIGERTFVGVGIVDAGSVFARAGRNGGDQLWRR